MSPGDLIFWRDNKYGVHRFWEIVGVFLGGERQESLVEIRSLNFKPGETSHRNISLDDESSETLRRHETTFVPEVLLRHAEIYTRDGGDA